MKEMQNQVNGYREGVTWFTFEILETPPYLGNGWSWKFQIRQADLPPSVL